jgi:hypothetical protein
MSVFKTYRHPADRKERCNGCELMLYELSSALSVDSFGTLREIVDFLQKASNFVQCLSISNASAV